MPDEWLHTAAWLFQNYQELLERHAWNYSEVGRPRQSAGIHRAMTADVVWTATS